MRDLRTKKLGNTRCQSFKVDDVEKGFLKEGAKIQGVFYAMDLNPSKLSANTIGSVNRKIERKTIKTNDVVNFLRVNDFVKMDGKLWRIESIIFDDNEENKKFSTRPMIETTLELTTKC